MGHGNRSWPRAKKASIRRNDCDDNVAVFEMFSMVGDTGRTDVPLLVRGLFVMAQLASWGRVHAVDQDTEAHQRGTEEFPGPVVVADMANGMQINAEAVRIATIAQASLMARVRDAFSIMGVSNA